MKPEQVPADLVTLAMEAAFSHLETPRDAVRLAAAEKHTRAALAAVLSVYPQGTSTAIHDPKVYNALANIPLEQGEDR